MQQKKYIAIDLKSFYASVECVERKLNPLTTHLVVADEDRTEKTICLAVTPSLKKYGLLGRSRLYEVIECVENINRQRRKVNGNKAFAGSTYDETELRLKPELSLSYITAKPRMAYYIEYSTRIYSIYLKYFSPEDMHVYSIDEVLIDVSPYLDTYQLSAYELAEKVILDIYHTTGITAAAGIGSNLYLCKVAMDIEAKHIPADKNGVRIAELDEMSYRKKLWNHQPITDFWRVGKGYAAKMERNGIHTMGDIARCSIGRADEFYNEDLLYRLFGVNAELLIDHAWGYEPCTIADIKAYRPGTNSLSSGQVLKCPYDYQKTAIIIKEMAENLSLELVEKKCATNQIVLDIGYDRENVGSRNYQGKTANDRYGRKVPKPSHGSYHLEGYTSSTKIISKAALKLYQKITDPKLLIRRVTIGVNNVINEDQIPDETTNQQLTFFTDYQQADASKEKEKKERARERKMQDTVLGIKKKFGKNAILKVTSLEEGATAVERNSVIGGHQA